MILDPTGIARAAGIGAGEDHRHKSAPASAGAASGEREAMLLFRAGATRPMAVPLSLVARLEQIPREQIELSASVPVVHYRGRLMPLVALSDEPAGLPVPPTQPVLVFADGERSAGLMVDEIVDVVEDRLNLELSAMRPGLLGTAVIGGQATDVIDTAYWLAQLPAAHSAPSRTEAGA